VCAQNQAAYATGRAKDSAGAMSAKMSPFRVLALFAVALAAPWMWFHVGVNPQERLLAFQTRTEVEGFRFVTESVSPQVADSLQTTNVVSGRFESGLERFSVFAADWRADSKVSMNVLGHTPDICWVRSGSKAIFLGQPSFIEVQLGAEKVIFECRVFQLPQGQGMEMVAWTSLVGGQPLEEGFRFQPPGGPIPDRSLTPDANGRNRRLNIFVAGLLDRRAASKPQQFVRFSTSVTDNWKVGFHRLAWFATHWLVIDAKSGS
jgi:hypothetical protein